MKHTMKLRLDDLKVTSLEVQPETRGGVHGAAYTQLRTCWALNCASAPGGPLCVTEQYGRGDTCETGPQYYC